VLRLVKIAERPVLFVVCRAGSRTLHLDMLSIPLGTVCPALEFGSFEAILWSWVLVSPFSQDQL